MRPRGGGASRTVGGARSLRRQLRLVQNTHTRRARGELDCCFYTILYIGKSFILVPLLGISKFVIIIFTFNLLWRTLTLTLPGLNKKKTIPIPSGFLKQVSCQHFDRIKNKYHFLILIINSRYLLDIKVTILR